MSKILPVQEFPLWEKLKNKHAPLSFSLELTARCNNNCRHCYINLPAGDRAALAAELAVDEIGSLADQAVELGALWCLITGGEPLLRPDFADIYLALKRKGLLVSVFTNAALVNEKHMALFKKYPPRDIEVTVYGITRETYERVTRCPGSFARFERGLKLLLENGVPLRLKSMAMQSNLDEQASIAAFCRARTSDYFRFDSQLHLRFDRNPARNAEICAERLTPEQIVDLERADQERMTALHDNCSKLINDEFSHLNCNHLFHCGAGSGNFYVSYDGRFRLCSSLWADGTTYDLRTGTLADAWNNFVPRVRDLRSQRREFLESCRRCSLVNLCLWCPALAQLETGAMDGATPYFCSVAHARAKMLASAS
jgi:radical SAM protein with 4Fe4S-binding SPASM domain